MHTHKVSRPAPGGSKRGSIPLPVHSAGHLCPTAVAPFSMSTAKHHSTAPSLLQRSVTPLLPAQCPRALLSQILAQIPAAKPFGPCPGPLRSRRVGLSCRAAASPLPSSPAGQGRLRKAASSICFSSSHNTEPTGSAPFCRAGATRAGAELPGSVFSLSAKWGYRLQLFRGHRPQSLCRVDGRQMSIVAGASAM